MQIHHSRGSIASQNEIDTESPSPRLIDPETPKLPINLREILRVMSDKLLTCCRTIVQILVVLPLGAHLAAKINVDDDALVAKVRRDVTVCAGEVGQSRPPRGSVRPALRIRDVVWDGVARKNPDSDACFSRFDRVYLELVSVFFILRGGGQETYTTAILVELLAICRRAALDSTARVPVLIVAG